jgi:predicted hydrolase (HD superfamily)
VTTEHSAPEAARPDRQAILDDIERTREQMGQTVEALAAKADVKAQVQRKAAEVTGTARQRAGRALTAAQQRPGLVVAAAGVGAGLITWLLTRPMRR